MISTFSSAYIEKLNAQHSGGVFLQAVEITETTSPLVVHRFVNNGKAISWNGNTYNPLFMTWGDFEIDHGMSLPTMNVVVPDANESIIDWVESFSVRENDCRLLILHEDLLSDVSAVTQHLLNILAISWSMETQLVTFILGLNIGLGDSVPRGIITKQEFPGIPDSNVRILA